MGRKVTEGRTEEQPETHEPEPKSLVVPVLAVRAWILAGEETTISLNQAKIDGVPFSKHHAQDRGYESNRVLKAWAIVNRLGMLIDHDHSLNTYEFMRPWGTK